jgi:hypothetical protein
MSEAIECVKALEKIYEQLKTMAARIDPKGETKESLVFEINK